MEPKSNTLQKILSGALRVAENVGVPALVSVFVSTGMASYFESRLENSKDHVAAIVKDKEEFDASQVNIFGQLGLYTNLVLSKDQNASKNDLYSAIVSAQIQLSRLRHEINAGPESALEKYASELETLRAQLENVKNMKDLKPVYVSAQKILALHDKVTDEVRSKMQVSLF